MVFSRLRSLAWLSAVGSAVLVTACGGSTPPPASPTYSAEQLNRLAAQPGAASPSAEAPPPAEAAPPAAEPAPPPEPAPVASAPPPASVAPAPPAPTRRRPATRTGAAH